MKKILLIHGWDYDNYYGRVDKASWHNRARFTNELLNDNPSYFKEIIPFAYVLNISNKWIKQFADIIDLESETYAELITDDISSFSSEMNEKTS